MLSNKPQKSTELSLTNERKIKVQDEILVKWHHGSHTSLRQT